MYVQIDSIGKNVPLTIARNPSMDGLADCLLDWSTSIKLVCNTRLIKPILTNVHYVRSLSHLLFLAASAIKRSLILSIILAAVFE